MHTWPAFLLPRQCYLHQSSCWPFPPSPESENKREHSNLRNTGVLEPVALEINCCTFTKLSVSFRQVWHGAVRTFPTESSERSRRAGRNGQAHHILQEIHFTKRTVKYATNVPFARILINTLPLSEKLSSCFPADLTRHTFAGHDNVLQQ